MKLTPMEKMWFDAVIDGKIPMLEKLLEKGVDINTTADGWFQSAVFFSIRTRNIEMYKFLRKSGALLNMPDNRGITSLRMAVETGDLDFISLILEEDPSQINIADAYGYTPFLIAASSGEIEIVNLLLSSGADFDVKDKEGSTPLLSLSSAKKIECICASC